MQVDVRVRHECDADAQPFTTAEISELDDVLRALRDWSLVSHGVDVKDHEMFGQFAYDDTGAYFEIVITA